MNESFSGHRGEGRAHRNASAATTGSKREAKEVAMEATGKIKAVFFDLDDTLVLTTEAGVLACESVCDLAQTLSAQKEASASINRAGLIARFMKGFDETPWDPEGKIEVTEWRAGLWNAGLEDQGLGDMPIARQLQTEYDRARMHHFKFVPGAVEMVERLRSHGRLAIVIITNGHHEVQRRKLEACGAAAVFGEANLIVGGEEELNGGHQKPHPSIFLKACTIAGCKPSEAVHIGDSLKTDVIGGRDAGLAATIWINPKDTALPEGWHFTKSGSESPESHPSEQVHVVTEVEKIINGWQSKGVDEQSR